MQPLWRTIWKFLKKTKNRATIWSCNPTSGHISGENHNLKMFIAALFTIAKTWKQPKCPLTDEWIKMMWYIYTMEYYSGIKKEWNNAICSNMDGPRDYHTKWSKSDRETQISYDIIHMWNLKKNDQMNLYKKVGGLPWWRSGWESACQCRGHGFGPRSGRIPHATERLGPWATIAEPARLEPVLRGEGGRDGERPAHRDEEWSPLAATGESPRTETKTQHSQK